MREIGVEGHLGSVLNLPKFWKGKLKNPRSSLSAINTGKIAFNNEPSLVG